MKLLLVTALGAAALIGLSPPTPSRAPAEATLSGAHVSSSGAGPGDSIVARIRQATRQEPGFNDPITSIWAVRTTFGAVGGDADRTPVIYVRAVGEFTWGPIPGTRNSSGSASGRYQMVVLRPSDLTLLEGGLGNELPDPHLLGQPFLICGSPTGASSSSASAVPARGAAPCG